MSNRDDENEAFLSRWSRRKRELARGVGGVPATAPADAQANDARTPTDDQADAGANEPELDLSTLPKVDELTAESDFTAFLDKRVPALLRNAALGRMWSLDPTIRDFIEVAENQWNWNVPGGAPFYEEILTPMTPAGGIVGEAVADAGQSIGHSLDQSLMQGGPLQTEPAGADTAHASTPSTDADVIPKYDARTIDQADQNAAEQNEPSTSDVYPVNPGRRKEAGLSIDREGEVMNVAAQQNPLPNAQPRKRHGGALPT